MTIGRLVALGGLFLSWWGFQQGDARALAWSVAVVAFSLVVGPLLGLDAKASVADVTPSGLPVPSPEEVRDATEASGTMPASRQRFER